MAASSDKSIFTMEGFSPKLKIKVVIAKMITNLPWLSEKDFLLTPTDSFSLKSKEVYTEAKNISVFHKLIFLKQPNQRTLFELQSLRWIFTLGFKFFKFCSKEVQIDLIRKASYRTYGPGRWILKEGHPSENMYMIIKGHVRITRTVLNPVFNSMEIIEYCKLGEKKSFGENAVMFDSHRTNSVQSLDTVEMISIAKSDFKNITEDNLSLLWHTNAMEIKKSSYLKHLSLMDLNKCSMVSFIQTFMKYDLILGEGIGLHDYGYFVIEGEISLVLRKKVTEQSNRPRNVEQRKPNKKIYERVDTCTFLSDSYFNIGEPMEDKEFIANENSKCLCIPHWFMKKTEKIRHWKFAKLALDRIIPNKREVFKLVYGDL